MEHTSPIVVEAHKVAGGPTLGVLPAPLPAEEGRPRELPRLEEVDGQIIAPALVDYLQLTLQRSKVVPAGKHADSCGT